MIEQEQIDFILNHPMFYPGAAFAGVVLLFIVFKFLIGSRSSDVSRLSEDAPKSTGRKRKGKKQKMSLPEKKSSDSPKAKKESRKNEMKSFIETDKQIFEEGKSDKKKDSKSKAKSKKKRNSQVKVESPIISKPEILDNGMDTGEWQTVSTKEQREQQRREKRKLEEDVAVAVEAASEKTNPTPLVQPAVIKPLANISAIAKGIAPRFARAAGETWQEKPATSVAPLPLQSKRPMPPATIPGATKQSSKNTTVKPRWSPGKSQWPGDVGTTWQYPTQTTTSTSLASEFMSWPPSDTTSSLLSMAAPGDKAGWPQGGSTWPSTATTTSSNLPFEDWVHVHEGQNGRNLNGTGADWVNTESSIHPHKATSIQKVDEWVLEPEGFPVHAPPTPLDPNSPWNFEDVGTEGNGDWYAPASSWDNTNEEWKAPTPVKPQPTYVDVSSDEDRISSKITSHQTSVTATTSPQSIVGAGPDFMNQAASNSQGQNKKSRRRRKKKTATNETETSSPLPSPTPEIETPKTETSEKLTPKKESESKPEQTSDATSDVKDTVQETKDDWTLPKAAKKRKNKARKAD